MCELDLIINMKNGNINAFEEIFELYKTPAVRTAYLISNNISLSDDIVQETFIQVYINIDKLKEPEKFKFWFYKILTRTAWKMCSKEKRTVPVETIFDNIEPDMTFDILSSSEQREEIFKAINKLSIKQRTVIVLFYFNNMSIKEISLTLKCFEGTVKSRLYFAKKKLFVELSSSNFFQIRKCDVNGYKRV